MSIVCWIIAVYCYMKNDPESADFFLIIEFFFITWWKIDSINDKKNRK